MDNDLLMWQSVIEVSAFVMFVGVLVVVKRWRR